MINEEKINICKEVLIKSGFDKNRRVIDSIANAVMKDYFLIERENNKIIKFVSWIPQLIEGKNKIFVNNLWIDSNYRGKDTILFIRKILRERFKNSRFIWFNRKNKKLIDRR